MTKLHALTLWQPWATIVTSGLKLVENRPWAPPKWLHGRQFAIHAGKKWDADGAETCERILISRGYALGPRDSYPSGVILGLATLDHVIDDAKDCAPYQRDWFFGPYGWILGNVLALAHPVPARGFQGLWPVPPDALAAISDQPAMEP